MFRSVQIKIILIIMVLAILMFIAYGMVTTNFISALNSQTNAQLVEEILNTNMTVLAIFTVSFIILYIIIVWFTSKVITKPIYKLIKSAEKIEEREERRDIPI